MKDLNVEPCDSADTDRPPGWSTGRGLEHILQNRDEREEAEVLL